MLTVLMRVDGFPRQLSTNARHQDRSGNKRMIAHGASLICPHGSLRRYATPRSLKSIYEAFRPHECCAC